MAKSPVLSDITNVYTSASTINENSRRIETSFRNTLSRDGSTPNQMEADLDMNSNDILNVRYLDAKVITILGKDLTTVIGSTGEDADRAEAAALLAELAAAAALGSAEDALNAANAALAALSSIQSEQESRAFAIANYHPAVAPEFIRVAGYETAGDGGAALYMKLASTPAHGAWFTLTTAGGGSAFYGLQENVVNPEMFGGIIGSANVNVGINRMLTYQRVTGAVIDGRNKTYPLTETISSVPYKNQMKNITLDGTGIPTNGLFTTPVFSMVCAAPSLVGNLTVNLGSHATSCTLSSAASVSAGDWVLLISTKAMGETEVNGDLNRQSKACELLQVHSKAGNVVTFTGRTLDSYAVSDSAAMYRVQTVGSVNWENVTCIGADTGLHMYDGFKNRYLRCNFINQTTRGLNEDRCIMTVGDKFYVSSEATGPNFTQAPYGISYVSCQNCSYGDISGNRTRHLTTTGSNAASRGRNVSRGNSLGDIYCTNSYSSAVDQHPGGGYIQVGNVYVDFADDATQKFAVQFQGGGGTVESIEAPNGGCVLFDCYGFSQSNFTPTVQIGHMHSRNSEFMFSSSNHTNRYGTGISQTIRFIVNSIDGYTGTGFSLNPLTGSIEGHIGSGFISSLATLGLNRVIYGTASGSFDVRVKMGPVNCRTQSGGRVIQLDAGRLQMFGGTLQGIGGAAEIRLTNAAVKLIAVDESSITVTQTGSSVQRAQLS